MPVSPCAQGYFTSGFFLRHPRSYYEKDWTRTRVFYHLFQGLRSDLMVIGSVEHNSIDLDRKDNVGPGNLPAVTSEDANTRGSRPRRSRLGWEGGTVCADPTQNLLEREEKGCSSQALGSDTLLASNQKGLKRNAALNSVNRARRCALQKSTALFETSPPLK